MDVFVLAGGLGTRLKGVVSDVPKPMAPVNGHPFLEYVLEDICKLDCIKNIIIGVGFKKEKITDYFGDSFKGVPIKYAFESEPLGTGGAILNSVPLWSGEDIIVFNGDTLFKVDLNDFLAFAYKQKTDIAIALKPMRDFDRYGTVSIDESQNVISFNEKMYCQEGLINGGIYYIKKEVFSKLDLYKNYKFSFEKEVFEKTKQNIKIVAKEYDDYFIDIGIPSDYNKANMELKSE